MSQENNKKLPKVNIIELLEAGVHFGHKTNRWNPKMQKFIFGQKNGVHVIDLRKTVPMFETALSAVYDVAASGGRILFVSTKKQSEQIIEEAAKKCGQYYVNFRWLGGMLTNWNTISKSIKSFEEINQTLSGDLSGYTKKEVLQLQRKKDKLMKAIGGIVEMAAIPDMLFVIDVNNDATAVKEAKRLSIPVVGVCDTNVNPDDVTYPIPGNDDSVKAISLYCDLVTKAILAGMQEGLSSVGFDIGEMTKDVESQKEDNNSNTEKNADVNE